MGDKTFIEILGNKKVMSILVFLAENSGEYSQVEIMRRAGLAKATAVRSLKLLAGAKIVSVRRIGPTNLYCLNKKSRVVFHISALRRLLR